MESSENITGLVSPQSCGIIWITKGKVDLNHPNIYELNYLLDGLLVQSLTEQVSDTNNNHFFLSENFGRPFFIGHVLDNNDTLKIIEEHLSMILPIVSEDSEVYIFNQSNHYQNLSKDLQKKYPQLRFKKL